MSAGYGRGYYGENQMAPKQPPKRGGWIKYAVIVGVGAVVWYMWPRKPAYDPTIGFGPFGGEPPQPPQPQPHPNWQPPQPAWQPQIAPSAPIYASPQAYEDDVVATARKLQQTGTKVLLAPHLQHLTARLEP
jgi:hypothetical protein